MKIEYDDSPRGKKPVALLINNDGRDLLVKCDEGLVCFYDDSSTPNVWPDESIDKYTVIRRFYPGDTVKITF